MENKFKYICSYDAAQFPLAIERLANEKPFMKILSTLFPLMPKEQLRERVRNFSNVNELQLEMIYPLLKYLEAELTTGISAIGLENFDSDKTHLFISNHRDIILDSAILSLILIENNMSTVEIAVGDNLFVYPWIEDLVRVNKGCVVKRGLTPREMLQSSIVLSEYIRYVLHDKSNSMWIAQREGRAKDSNDRTQTSLLKMLTLGGKSGDLIEDLKELNICPVTISYEYDPCDFLKAKDFQLKRDNPDHKKTPEDDLINMKTGIMGYKGKVVYHFSGSINKELEAIKLKTHNKKELLKLIVELIDEKIHLHYNITNVNKIAYDIFFQENKFINEYSIEEKNKFLLYVEKQVKKVDLKERDDDFLKTKILEMYANPLKNKLEALQSE